MNIDIDIRIARHFECIGHFKSVTSRHTNAGQQLIDVGRTVGIADFHGLLPAGVALRRRFERIGFATHVHIARPSERNAHQHRPIAIAPAHIGGRFLMRHKAEIRSRILVAEGCQGRSQIHQAGNHSTRIVAQFSRIVEHEVLAVARDTHVNMEAGARFSGGDFRCKRHVEPFFVSQIADDPFGNHQLVGGFTHRHRQKFDLVLLVDQTVLREIAHF